MVPTAKIEGNELVLRLPTNNPPRESGSRLTLLVACTDGPQKTALTVQGKILVVNVNAYIENPTLTPAEREQIRAARKAVRDVGRFQA